MFITFSLMFLLLIALLSAHAAQARHVHVQDSGFAGSRALYEENYDELSFGRSFVSQNPQFPALLHSCLADAACSDALAAAATAATAARQQHREQQQHLVPGLSSDAASGDSGPLPCGEDRGGGTAASTDTMWVDSGGLGVGSSASLALGRGSVRGNHLVAHAEEEEEDPTSLSLKGLAALVLFLEAVAGMYLPLLLQHMQSPQWWLSLLNCFSGGIFLAAGIIHLLPHCAEAQEALGPIGPNGDYPLYLVLVVVGYCVVFYVERVLFDVHGEGHAHCQHSNVYSHSSYYKAISHRSQRVSRLPSGTAAVVCIPDLSTLPAHAHTSRAGPGGLEAATAAAPGLAALPSHLHSHPPPHPHHHQHKHGYRPPQPLLEGCGDDSGGAGAAQHSGEPDDGDAGAAAAGAAAEQLTKQHSSHGHGQQQHLRHQLGSSNSSHAGKLPLLPSSLKGGLCLVSGVGFALPSGAVADGDDGDAESCHSDHPPLATCVCVEEKEAEAEAEARALRGAGPSQAHHHNHNHNHDHNHNHNHNHRHAQGFTARGGSGSGGSSRVFGGDGGGGSGDDHLRMPLLAETRASAAPAPQQPAPPALDDAGVAANGDGGELRAAAQLQALHPPDSCAYHTHHHHPHHHHRYRRRSIGHGPLPTTSVGGGGAGGSFTPDSRASSCVSFLAGHALDGLPLLPPTHHHSHPHPHSTHHNHNHQPDPHDHHHHQPDLHDHHHHHHHVIKPRFRFMHGVVLLVALALHTALECVALGLIDSRPQFLVLFAAIASHKVVSALALASRFLREGATLGQVTAYVGPFCLVAPASILVGVYVGRVAPIARLVFSCFATGTFLYVGASEVIMEEFEGEMRADRRDISTRAARYIKFAAVLAAVALVAASGLLPEPDHH